MGRLQVQAAILDSAKDYSFPVIEYDRDGYPQLTARTEIPQTPLLCNEIEESFERDNDYKRALVLRTNNWQFSMRLRFKSEVLLEGFEDKLKSSPPVTSDGTRVYVKQKSVEHPIQQNASVGTVVEYLFEAVQGRN